MKRALRPLALLLCLAAVACTEAPQQAPRRLGSAAGCDAAVTPCAIQQQGITVSLTLASPVRALQPFAVSLSIEGVEVEPQSVLIDFQMAGMDMGSNRYRLQAKGAQWQGTVTLPICSASRMDWLAEAQFDAEGQRYLARFPFHSEAN